MLPNAGAESVTIQASAAQQVRVPSGEHRVGKAAKPAVERGSGETVTDVTPEAAEGVLERGGRETGEAAGQRARQKAERALNRKQELREILANPEVARAAHKLMEISLADREELVKIWKQAQKIGDIEQAARTRENTRWARYVGRREFSAQRRRFWELVAQSEEGKKARAIIEAAGFRFTGKPGTAPIFPGLPGKAGRLSIDHYPTRIADDPFKAIDPSNLRFITEEENTFLEVLRANLRQHEQQFGGTFE
jgi:hypothetical protein